MATILEQFNFTQFKAVMNIADIDEQTYALILRAVFSNLELRHEIVFDDLTEVKSDLVFAIYRHAKFIFDTYKHNIDTIKNTSDSSGNKTTFNSEAPADVVSTYKMHSPRLTAYL